MNEKHNHRFKNQIMIHLIVNDNFINWKLVQIFGQWRLTEEILNRNSIIEKVSIRQMI